MRGIDPSGKPQQWPKTVCIILLRQMSDRMRFGAYLNPWDCGWGCAMFVACGVIYRVSLYFEFV